MRRRAFECGLAAAALAHPVNDVGLLRAHRLHHRGQQLGRILEVGVDDQHVIAAAQIEARRQRQLVAMIARQVDSDEARNAGRELPHLRPAAIARAVVDEHDLIILIGGLSRGRGQPLVQRGEARLLVEARHDNRKRGHQCKR